MSEEYKEQRLSAIESEITRIRDSRNKDRQEFYAKLDNITEALNNLEKTTAIATEHAQSDYKILKINLDPRVKKIEEDHTVMNNLYQQAKGASLAFKAGWAIFGSVFTAGIIAIWEWLKAKH